MKKLLSSLVLAALLLSSFAACGEEKPPVTDPTDTTSAVETSAEDTTPADTRVYPNLPDKTFDNANFTIWYRADTKKVGIEALETTGDLVNDAVFTRNTNIEEKHKIKFVMHPGEAKGTNHEATEALRALIMAGDGYDAVIAGLKAAGGLTVSKMTLNLKEIPHLDFSKPWWNKSATEQLTLNNKLFLHPTNLFTNNATGANIMHFNKGMLVEFGFNVEELYQTTFDGKWTTDLMFQICSKVSFDLNGDGVMNENDRWGYVSTTSETTALVLGCQVNYVKQTENGTLVCDADSAKNIETLQFLSQKLVNNPDVWFAPSDKVPTLYREGGSLFRNHAVSSISSNFEKGTIDSGILPIPKLNEEQEYYRCHTTSWNASALCLPITTPNTDKSGYIIEALCAESQYTLVPAFYETTLKERFATDPQMTQIFDIVWNSLSYELCDVFSIGGDLTTKIRNTLNSGSTDFASTIAGGIPTIQADLDKLNEAVK